MKRYLTEVLMLVFILGFTSAAIAGGPKCPCYKAKDLEVLVNKGWVVHYFEQQDGLKLIRFQNPEEWNYDEKGKFLRKTFSWVETGGDEDICEIVDSITKWKTENYRDFKSKGKTRPMSAGGDESDLCESIVDDFINSLPPS